MPAVPIPRKIQALIKIREQKGGGAGRVIQAGGGGCNMAGAQVVSTVRNLPKVYSPLYEFSNLMLPRDMKTMNAWNRQFFATNPIVRNAITLHATYPISKFSITCEDPKVKEFFEDMFDRMGFRGVLMGIALEFWKLGERLDADSLITMGDGSVKKITDIEVGDLVLTHTGSSKKVLAVIPKFTRAPDEEGNPVKVYKMKVVGSNEPLIITGNHPVYSELFEDVKCSVPSWADFGQKCWPNTSCSSTITKGGKTYPGCRKCKKWNMSFRKTSELSKNDQVAFAFNAEIRDISELTEDWCKLLGYFLSEGCFLYNTLKDGSKVICGIDIATTEKEINDEVANLIQKVSSHPAGRILLQNGIEHVRMYDSKLGRLIKIYCGEHASHKQLHNDLMLLPPAKHLALLGAFINGDGSVDISNGQIQISTSSRSLINQFIIILARMGIGAVLTNHTAKPNHIVKAEYNIKPNYRITIKSFNTGIFKEAILPRKAALLKPATKRANYGVVWNNLYVRSIQKLEDITTSYDKEVMYDLEVEDDHSYIANGVVVHNCFPYLELDEENGVWDYAFLHNPDFIRVKTNALARYPAIYLVPDDSLRRLVQGRSSADAMMRQQLPAETAFHIMKGEDIPLPNFNISHIKMMNSEYDVRGTSIITSCYKDLMLYDKLREMQFAQADGMINPLTLVKLGDPSGTWRPNDEDIRAFQQIMEESQYDPDFKIVTHGAVDIQRIGYSGATLDVSQMWDAINKNLYTGLLAPEAILNGEGPNYSCNSADTATLTNQGFKTLEELVQIDSSKSEGNLSLGLRDPTIKIATFNPETEELEYRNPTECHVYKFDSEENKQEMIHFHTQKIDILVTPNHKMWVDCRKTDTGWHNNWHFEQADQVKRLVRRFRSVVKWTGNEPDSIKLIGKTPINIEAYLKMAGYYLSEGWLESPEYSSGYQDRRVCFAQQQYRKPKIEGGCWNKAKSFQIMHEGLCLSPYKINLIKGNSKGEQYRGFGIYDAPLLKHMESNFGHYAHNKKIPQELKNLSCKYLRILLEAIMLGDSHTSTSNDHGRQGVNAVPQHQFFSVSQQLADDVYEMVFKLGYAPTMRREKRGQERGEQFKNQRDIWWVEWSESDIGKFPTLDTRSVKYPDGAISRVPYKGYVYCFSVPPHHLFITRRNGKITIQGNTASIGLEVLRTRYDRFREQLAQWIEKKVLEPICKLQDFYMTKGGVRNLIVPKVQWNRLNLRDMDSYIASITGLLATPEAPGKVSDCVLFESLDLDYEEEKKRLRKEAIDRAMMTQELQALGKMSLEELQTLDPDKPIIDTHKGEAAPVSPEQMLGAPGGMPGGPMGKPPKGGLPGGGGGGIGKPPRAPVGEGGKPPAGGVPTAPTPGGIPTPAPGGPPPAAPKGPAPGA
jgi:hypothetical protein